jgi:hypothetical protein
LKSGVLHLPNNQGEVVPIHHPTISPSIRDKLSYSNFPLGLMTHNGIEVFRESEGRVFTLRFFLPGIIVGLWESLAPPKSHFPKQIWDVTAGARFIFALPKIQATAHYSRLKKEFNLSCSKPVDIFQQWRMFKQIANHPNFAHNWYQELYFFPNEWLIDSSKNVDWLNSIIFYWKKFGKYLSMLEILRI